MFFDSVEEGTQPVGLYVRRSDIVNMSTGPWQLQP